MDQKLSICPTVLATCVRITGILLDIALEKLTILLWRACLYQFLAHDHIHTKAFFTDFIQCKTPLIGAFIVFLITPFLLIEYGLNV
jgi:hypothetical protein